jgi:hypothetical protein
MHGQLRFLIKPFARQLMGSLTPLSTLNGWAKSEGCPVEMYLELDGGRLYVGLTDHEFHPINLPEDYFGVLPSLPKLALKTAAA